MKEIISKVFRKDREPLKPEPRIEKQTNLKDFNTGNLNNTNRGVMEYLDVDNISLRGGVYDEEE